MLLIEPLNLQVLGSSFMARDLQYRSVLSVWATICCDERLIRTGMRGDVWLVDDGRTFVEVGFAWGGGRFVRGANLADGAIGPAART